MEDSLLAFVNMRITILEDDFKIIPAERVILNYFIVDY